MRMIMTTPQNELYNLSYKIKELHSLFKVEEDEVGLSIFDSVKQLYIGHGDIVQRLERLEGQLALIIKLLTIDESPQKKKTPKEIK
jgi:hypothetical protein